MKKDNKNIKSHNYFGKWSAYYPEDETGHTFLMFRCNERKAMNYVKNNLAKIIGENKFMLTFVPNGDGDKYLLEKENVCVVSGATDNLRKHYIVPRVYVQQFDDFYKNSNTYDILMLREDIHNRYEIEARKLNDKLAKQANIEIVTEQLKEAKLAARAILNFSKVFIDEDYIKTCWDKINLYRKIDHTVYSLSEIIEKHERLTNQNIYEIIYKNVTDIVSFQEMWRKHFVDTLNPKFLPEKWKIIKPAEAFFIRNKNKNKTKMENNNQEIKTNQIVDLSSVKELLQKEFVNIDIEQGINEISNNGEVSLENLVNYILLQHKNKLSYLNADFVNFKNRTSQDIENAKNRVKEQCMNDIIVLSNEMETAKTMLGEEEVKIVNIFQSKFNNTLTKNNIIQVDLKEGDIFNEDTAHCMSYINGGESMKGKVINIIEKGYSLNGKIIKYPSVVVGS